MFFIFLKYLFKHWIKNFHNWNNDGTIADMYSPYFPTSHYLTTFLSTKTTEQIV